MHPHLIERNVALELMDAWRTRREVIVVLTAPRAGKREDAPHAPADRSRVRGYVQSVAATCAFALLWDGVADAHIPLALVRAVRVPHFAAPEDGAPVSAPPPRVVIELPESQLSLF